MSRYIEENEIYKLVEPRGMTKVHCSQIDELPRADVVPKSEVAREIIAKFKTKMYSEIARNELLAEYGDDFYEGRIDASLTAIDLLAEIVMEYCSSAQNEGIDV